LTPSFVQKLSGYVHGEAPPEGASLLASVNGALEALGAEQPERRPPDGKGRPGGVLQLDPGIPTILVPDIHGRRELLLRVLGYVVQPGLRTLQALARGRVQVLCLGDGMHAEARAAARWRAALEEFQEGYRRHENMDEEMRESLGVMGIVMEAKRSFPSHFHFLKGNHENIANAEGDGNFPFRKFALEGLMVVTYMRQFYGEEVLAAMARFERELPLLATGRGFLASHAEPRAFFPRERVIGYRGDAEVVAGLTWTDNDEADPSSVDAMLEHYLGADSPGAFYFGGHRPVPGRFGLRAAGRYVQLHNPGHMTIACLAAEGDIDLVRDIRGIGGD
jgi:hypothetical protein